ncbi:MAG: DUF6011 domain-containing protein [Streptosporangiales bacterium]
MTAATEHTHQPRCLRCGRSLRAARSVSAGYGRWCAAKIRAAQLAEILRGFTAAQIEKARELIADGGLIPTRRPGVFDAVSSDGTRTYKAHSATCTCPWGLRGKAKACAHSLAVRIVLASGKAA